MRICVVSTPIFTVPCVGYAGLEQLAYLQAVGLAKLGHKVLLIAPRGSTAPGCELHETTVGEGEQQAFMGYQDRLKNYDVIIDNSWQKWTYLAGYKSPILGVCHAPIDTMYSVPPPVEKPCFVAISHDQAEHINKHLKIESEVCHNGVDPEFYYMSKGKRNNRYLFLARFSTIKGPDIAINVAKKTNIEMDMVGDDKITQEPDLMRGVFIECSLNSKLRYVGPQTRGQCVEWFNSNKALLHPNQRYREPFGLSIVEANLCGMPVIAWDNGALRETILNKETGFLVKNQSEMEELIKTDAVRSIKPKRCREWAMKFSVDVMVRRYEELCKKAMSKRW